MTPLDILWYSRSAHPCPLGLAAQLGGFIDEFRDDPFPVFTVQESPDAAVRESHVDHHLPNFIRQGGNAPALWARSCGAKTRLIGLSWMDEFQGILTLPSSGIQTVADLVGRRLALPLSDSLIDTARAEALHGFLVALRTQQLGPSDVKFSDLLVHRSSLSTSNQKLPPGLFGEYARQMGALLRREVDAVYVKGARGLQAARTAQAHVVIDLRSHPDAKSRVHNGTPRPITVDEGLLKSHPEVVERFLARVLAPVNAPTSCPNSSLSASCSEMAPQFTATKGPVRPLRRCTWRAISSLPVPLSPSIMMGAVLGATRSISSSKPLEAGSTNTSDLARMDKG